ncbi:MAG: hypothetical protein IJ574_05485 [Bacilli bacterium]|nr:hypothetical protein [Bacilli bacterium]
MEYTINEFWSDGFDKIAPNSFKLVFNINNESIKGKFVALEKDNNNIIENENTIMFANFNYTKPNLDAVLSIVESFYLASNDISDCKVYQYNDNRKSLSRLIVKFVIDQNDYVFFEIVGLTTLIEQYRNIINKILDLKDMKYNYNMYKELQNKTKAELVEELDKNDLVDAVILKRTR